MGRSSFEQLLAGSSPTAEAITNTMVERLIDSLAAEEWLEASNASETERAEN
jgi:hypothetical protein